MLSPSMPRDHITFCTCRPTRPCPALSAQMRWAFYHYCLSLPPPPPCSVRAPAPVRGFTSRSCT
ncbi:hypothetical protein CERSUDRAFT_117425 [Gelatoporia subvermispora B]|uniref:Uncharacterized protein n=1 Tax=Ceriporiopsis subvermispora (strain B) TaxID=914234 RepID=M2R4S0_CERS8|nr:hypothetical protein CERSUDRAFT_117425 [Gelatoporia subvermispora B]